MRMLRWLLLCALAAIPAMAQTVPAPTVTMRLSSDRILLGEPVWVLVTARNASAVMVRWNPGDYGFTPGELPVTAVITDAARGNGRREPCPLGSGFGDRMMGVSTTELAPGDSATWRYLLEGDFHFDRAGTYRVELTSHPGVAFHGRGDMTSAADRVPVTQAFTLQVLPQDDAALLVRERRIDAEIDAALLREPLRRGIPSSAERTGAFRQSQNVAQLRKGLVMHPVRGMEPIFAQWLEAGTREAITGFKNLNTPDSRAALAEIASTPDKPNHVGQWVAVRALGEMGDQQYFPLMVQLLSSPDNQVRRSAILGIGYLGSDSAAATLLEIAHKGTAADQEDAMLALSNTQSLRGVRALIDLMAAPDIVNPTDAETWLFVLTHHRLENVTPRRTTEQTFEAWNGWWNAGGKATRVYSPFECAP